MFKTLKDNRSVEYKTSGWKLHSIKRRITFTDKKGIGELKLLGKWDIHTYPVKSIKRVRLVRCADGYYCQFAVDVEWIDIQPKTGQEIGLDVGLESFYTDSNGHQEPNPRFLRKSERAIKYTQRQVSKKKKGSSNRCKARVKLSKKHLKVSRQRNEHAKKLARNVCKSNDLVAYEDLKVSNMVKNHCLAKSISDAGWDQFRQWLEHFARKFGKLAIAVSPDYTSQECSKCKRVVKKSLSTRTHVCECGCILHRDWNAALNILQAEFKFDQKVPIPGQEMTGLSISATGATLMGLRSRKNWATLADKLPDPDGSIVGTITEEPSYHLTPLEWQIWEYTKVTISLNTIAKELRLPIGKVQEIAYLFIAVGLAEEVPLLASNLPSQAINLVPTDLTEESPKEKIGTSFVQNLVGFLRSHKSPQLSITTLN